MRLSEDRPENVEDRKQEHLPRHINAGSRDDNPNGGGRRTENHLSG